LVHLSQKPLKIQSICRNSKGIIFWPVLFVAVRVYSSSASSLYADIPYWAPSSAVTSTAKYFIPFASRTMPCFMPVIFSPVFPRSLSRRLDSACAALLYTRDYLLPRNLGYPPRAGPIPPMKMIFLILNPSLEATSNAASVGMNPSATHATDSISSIRIIKHQQND